MATDDDHGGQRDTDDGPTPTIESDAEAVDDANAYESEIFLPAPVEGAEEPLPSIPDPIEPRPYIEIQPSETPVDPFAVEQAMDLLEALLRETTKTGLRHKLTRSVEQPLVEWLLVSNGRDDPSIRYLVGSTHDDLIEDVEGILRTCFPNTYEFRTVEWHPRRIEEYLPITIPAEDPPEDPRDGTGPYHPAITPERPYVAGVEYLGRAKRSQDWQTPLSTYIELTRPTRDQYRAQHDESRRVPLASFVEAMVDARVPVLFQVVIRPYGDWSSLADTYINNLEEGTVSTGDHIWEVFFPRDREDRRRYEPPPNDQERIDGIAARDPRRTFCVSARAVALTRDDPPRADAVARRLTSAFGHVSGRTHELVGHLATDDEFYSGIGPPPGGAIYDDLCVRASYPASYHRLGDRLRRRPHESRGIVVAPAELPGLCILDGAGLTPNGGRALATRPAERTGMPLPPPEQLSGYLGPGMPLCHPLTHDRLDYGTIVSVPAALQPRHQVIGGATGAGKSVQMAASMLGNAMSTDGLDVLFDLKGDGMATNYLRSHYKAFGTLENVLYFDCTDFLPALSFFDIRDLLSAGVAREEATSRKAGHYEEILEGVMGPEQFGQAVVSPAVITTHIKALFDPIHGSDAFPHRDLQAALDRTQSEHAGPPVSDEDLEGHFSRIVETDPRMFSTVMAGAQTRTERIGLDGRLAPVFNHVPGDADPRFDFAEHLNEDYVVIFDFGGMESKAKRALTLVFLAALWDALKARTERVPDGTALPVVNVYLEEAATAADTALVDDLLSEGRSFGLSVMMGLQFLGQLRSRDTDTYYEVLNETATFLVGRVAVDHELAEALATEDTPASRVENRLRALGPGEWMVRLGAEFADATPRPFLARSLAAPPGHPASDESLTAEEEATFQALFEGLRTRTESEYGLTQHDPPAVDSEDLGVTEEPDVTTTRETAVAETAVPRVDSLLPYTHRLPKCVDYDSERHALRCGACGNRYDPTIEGMGRAIGCCHSLDEVDRDDIPICEFNLKLSLEEIAASEWSDRQLLFTQAVYNAQQRRYHPLEYDITRDSMLRLQEYVGISADEVVELIDAGVIRHDTDRPHKLYSVAPDGRSVIGEAYREGVDYGHGKGDLEESSEHVLGMVLGERLARQAFIDDPGHPGETLSPYHEIGEGRRLDIAVLDADGDIVVAIEVERINHDYREAVPADFDKMAAVDPDEAIWIVLGRQAGHDVVTALNDPPDGEPRVEKTYSENTPPRQFTIDTPGLTAVYPVEYIRDTLLDDA